MYTMKYDHIHPIFSPNSSRIPFEFQSQNPWAAIEPTNNSMLRTWQSIKEQFQEGIQCRINYKKENQYEIWTIDYIC